jgi:uncharacterized protein (TIGR02271 family)
MAERTLTALYDTNGAAESARDDLVALGLTSGDITIRGTSTEGGGSDASLTDTTTGQGTGTGFWGGLADLFAPDEDRHTYAEGIRRGSYLLTARVPDGLEDQAIAAIERHEPIDLDQRAESWRQEGWTGYEGPQAVVTERTTATGTTSQDYGRTTGTSSAASLSESYDRTSDTAMGGELGAATVRTGQGEDVVQRAEEELRVGKREVGRGGVRVRSYVVERPVEEQVSLREERVQVERRPVNRAVEPGEAVFQEKVIEASERGEEAVVSKTARVVEEIGIRKDVDTRTETIRDTVRQQEVEIEDDRSVRGSSSGTVAVDEEAEAVTTTPTTPRNPA